ncbi:SDR family oxidoreductase [Deinococcus peraridilitoris]|uniref:Putative nucleoside-diphosphate sugar epimerase n=1 Tax=Deinococcus peraridilitoris (strain DSM 19664 / LMG 22246 / CIP 109416 / KR-200) TaxID=937777 RepID=L0A3T8_DEIPD|nr:NAD(P)H-binding protein [Deinococcus peraridilitoris]AFZ67857.1 putative nucleoside-diphosphate sugar epimerase [Deinococcus peraridilitoris DSM 19664]
MRILVTGGTGTLGRQVVRALQTGEETRVRVLSRRSAGAKPAGPEATEPQRGVEWAQADFTRGADLSSALAGVDTVVHAAHDSASLLRGDLGGLRHLLRAVERAGTAHFVYVSIVGADRVPGMPYYAAKVTAERMVQQSAVPHSIFRASQFHGLIDALLGGLSRAPWLLLPSGWQFQGVDVGEVGARLALHARRPEAGEVNFAGPEVRTLGELARAWQQARGKRKPIRELPLPFAASRAVVAGHLTSPGAERGHLTWEEWLTRRADRAQRQGCSSGAPGQLRS